MYKEIIKIGDIVIVEDDRGIKKGSIYSSDLNEKLAIENNIEALENKRKQNASNAIYLSEEVAYFKKKLEKFKIFQILFATITFILFEIIPSYNSILIDVLGAVGVYGFIEILVYPIKGIYEKNKKELYAYKTMDKYLEDDIVKEKVKLKETVKLNDFSFTVEKINNSDINKYNKKYDDMYNYYISDDALITDTKVKKLTRRIK